jgi:hypothetical protein
MRHFLRTSAALLAAMLAGCALDIPTDPERFPVEQNRVSHLRAAQTVGLSNGYATDAKAELKMGPHTWVLDQKKMTDTAIVMLRRPLEKHGVTAGAPAGKTITLRLRVLSARLHGMAPVVQTNARVALDAQFGDSTSTSAQGDNTSPWGADRAFDGAILFALNQLLIDQKFVDYMNR